VTHDTQAKLCPAPMGGAQAFDDHDGSAGQGIHWIPPAATFGRSLPSRASCCVRPCGACWMRRGDIKQLEDELGGYRRLRMRGYRVSTPPSR
jgi:hypothetical protein